MAFNLLSVVMLLGAVQGLFLALLLRGKKTHRTANRMLAALMAVYSLGLASIALEIANAYFAFPHLLGTTTALPFLYGPLHYLYAKYLCAEQQTFQKLDVGHVVPFLLYTVYLLPFYLESAAYKHAFFSSMLAGEAPVVLDIAAGLKGAHGLTYMFLTLYLLKRHEQKRHRSSSATALPLNWLWRITLITTGIWGMNALLLLSGWMGIRLFVGTDIVVGIAVAVAIYALGYFGLRQSTVFSTREASRQTMQKYERSGLSPEQAEQYLRRLHRAMNEDQVFRQSRLTLQTLADHLEMSPNHLSQIINERLGKNFFDLVNTYRVEEAKKQLLDPTSEHLTILAIAYEVGFNSKSAFNAAFRKHTHMTPTQFRKRPNDAKRGPDR
ncbi:MAG: helix-turn-helix domain-containing protein [Rhodothermales bacterium]